MFCIVQVRTHFCVCVQRSIPANCCNVKIDRNVVLFFLILNVLLAGTMVIVEKALLLDEFKESHCHHCLHWTPGPVPCRQCSQVSPSFFLASSSTFYVQKRLF